MSASLWGCELKCAEAVISCIWRFVSLLVRLWVEICRIEDSYNGKIVSLLVRLWVEIDCEINALDAVCVSLLVRLWVEMNSFHSSHTVIPVSLLVRLWVEIFFHHLTCCHYSRQPPCEAVSWNAKYGTVGTRGKCQPPCEAVSWNSILAIAFLTLQSQPPCEAVSWNDIQGSLSDRPCVSLLVRLWVEILIRFCERSFAGVSLLVRLWVEMSGRSGRDDQKIVSLLVRLWVEILSGRIVISSEIGQPPCEAVSWNKVSNRG